MGAASVCVSPVTGFIASICIMYVPGATICPNWSLPFQAEELIPSPYSLTSKLFLITVPASSKYLSSNEVINRPERS